jgi:hypothetical protein
MLSENRLVIGDSRGGISIFNWTSDASPNPNPKFSNTAKQHYDIEGRKITIKSALNPNLNTNPNNVNTKDLNGLELKGYEIDVRIYNPNSNPNPNPLKSETFTSIIFTCFPRILPINDFIPHAHGTDLVSCLQPYHSDDFYGKDSKKVQDFCSVGHDGRVRIKVQVRVS